VLSDSHFRPGARYLGYAPSSSEALEAFTINERQKAIQRFSKDVNRWTQRYFFPYHRSYLIEVKKKATRMFLDIPLIGLSAATVIGDEEEESTTYDLDIDSIKVYNRHLNDLLSPDDRENPKIDLDPSGVATDLYGPSFFPSGSKNLRLVGAFGYTDPNGGPMGECSEPLRDVVVTLASRALLDPTGSDPFYSNLGRVKSARTRDQSITFDTSATGDATMTGDPRLDAILVTYLRPPYVGVTG
jgi:hypothetical protein